MQRFHLTIAATAFAALAGLSPIFGQRGHDLSAASIGLSRVNRSGPGKKSIMNMKFTPAPNHGWNEKQRARNLKRVADFPQGQYPEYLALEAKNLASGKWKQETLARAV